MKIDDDLPEDIVEECKRKWLSMITCARCHEQKYEKERIFNLIASYVNVLRSKPKKEVIAEIRKGLIHTTREYAKLIAAYYNADTYVWEEVIVDLIMEQPDRWQAVMKQLRKTGMDYFTKEQQAQMAEN